MRQRQEGKEQHVRSPEDRGQCTPASRKSSEAGWGMRGDGTGGQTRTAATSVLMPKDERRQLSQGIRGAERKETRDTEARGQDQIQHDMATKRWRE